MSLFFLNLFMACFSSHAGSEEKSIATFHVPKGKDFGIEGADECCSIETPNCSNPKHISGAGRATTLEQSRYYVITASPEFVGKYFCKTVATNKPHLLISDPDGRKNSPAFTPSDLIPPMWTRDFQAGDIINESCQNYHDPEDCFVKDGDQEKRYKTIDASGLICPIPNDAERGLFHFSFSTDPAQVPLEANCKMPSDIRVEHRRSNLL